MADLAVWQRTIVDPAGNTVPNAEVEVRHSDSSALADIYLDREGAQAAPNPIAADGNGFVRFYAPGGAYRVEAYGGGATAVWDFVAVGRLAEHDAIGADQFGDDEGEHEAIRDKLDLASGEEVEAAAEAADTAVDLASEEALLAGEFFQSEAEAETGAPAHSIARDESGEPILPFDQRGQPILYLEGEFHQTVADSSIRGGIAVDGRLVLPWDENGLPVVPTTRVEAEPVALLRRPDVAQSGSRLCCVGAVHSQEPEHLAYQWYRDGVKVPGAVAAYLDDAPPGIYRCEVTATFPAARISEMSLPWAVGETLTPEEQAERDADTDYRAAVRLTDPMPAPSIPVGEFAAVDAASGQPIFLSDADTVIPIASTTKMVTLILLERWAGDLSETATVTEDHLDQSGTMMGLQVGDVVTLEDLAYGLMLPSGNDAGLVISDVIGAKMRAFDGDPPGTYEDNKNRFVQAMQDYASSIDPDFDLRNPHGGLGGSNTNSGTPRGVALLAAEGVRHPFTALVSSTRERDVWVEGPNARWISLLNTARSLMSDDGFVMGKTGFGGGGNSGIYASVWDVNGSRVALVVSNAASPSDRFARTRELRDAITSTVEWVNGWAQLI